MPFNVPALNVQAFQNAAEAHHGALKLKAGDGEGNSPIIKGAGKLAWIKSALHLGGARKANADILTALKDAVNKDGRYNAIGGKRDEILSDLRGHRPLTGVKIRTVLKKLDTAIIEARKAYTEQINGANITDKDKKTLSALISNTDVALISPEKLGDMISVYKYRERIESAHKDGAITVDELDALYEDIDGMATEGFTEFSPKDLEGMISGELNNMLSKHAYLKQINEANISDGARKNLHNQISNMKAHTPISPDEFLNMITECEYRKQINDARITADDRESLLEPIYSENNGKTELISTKSIYKEEGVLISPEELQGIISDMEKALKQDTRVALKSMKRAPENIEDVTVERLVEAVENAMREAKKTGASPDYNQIRSECLGKFIDLSEAINAANLTPDDKNTLHNADQLFNKNGTLISLEELQGKILERQNDQSDTELADRVVPKLMDSLIKIGKGNNEVSIETAEALGKAMKDAILREGKENSSRAMAGKITLEDVMAVGGKLGGRIALDENAATKVGEAVLSRFIDAYAAAGSAKNNADSRYLKNLVSQRGSLVSAALVEALPGLADKIPADTLPPYTVGNSLPTKEESSPALIKFYALVAKVWAEAPKDLQDREGGPSLEELVHYIMGLHIARKAPPVAPPGLHRAHT